MPEKKLSTHIDTAAAKTLEALAFLEVYPMEDTPEYKNSDTIAVHLQILAPYHGTLGLKTSKSFLTTVAEGLFSLPAADITLDQLTDLLNELLNTIAGSFLSSALPTDKIFKISTPSQGLANHEIDRLNVCIWNYETDAGNFSLYGAGEMIEKL